MKKITKEELEVFLRKHKLWLEDKKGGERADLREADLRGADLQGADLREADLQGAYLQGAYLRGAYLQGADLREADLREAYLREAYLQGADLQGADLREAYLQGADLREADLQGAKNVFVPLSCPEEGEFIGFKKARSGYIVKLKIPEDAKRSSATGRKCRCSKAIVLSITTKNGEDDGTTEIASSYDSKFLYKVGETVEVENFCEDRFEECAPGIHFFITRKEAEDYNV